MKDNKIIELFEARDQKAIVETSNKYGAYLKKICMNILNIHEESEECLNDTYHIAWNKIPPDRPQIFLAYLGRIAKNTALNRYDYLSAEKRNTHFDSSLSELEEIFDSGEDLLDSIASKELASSISEFLRSADKKPRNIFIRRYWYNDSISEIATMFGISESNAKVILLRVRQKLKAHLVKEGYVI